MVMGVMSGGGRLGASVNEFCQDYQWDKSDRPERRRAPGRGGIGLSRARRKLADFAGANNLWRGPERPPPRLVFRAPGRGARRSEERRVGKGGVHQGGYGGGPNHKKK